MKLLFHKDGIFRSVPVTLFGLLAFLVSILQPTILSAANEKIADIVITGNESRETASILPLLKSKVGGEYSAEKANEDVKEIYRIGIFRNVSVESVKRDAGVTLVFTVVEKPKVRAISVIGNKEIESNKIREAIDLKAKQVFSQDLLAKSVKKIKSLYADEGYYLAEVEAETKQTEDNAVQVFFKVTEGSKVLIKTISFEGNKVFSARKLRKQMETKEKWFLSWITGAGTYKEAVLKTDTMRIADLYYNNGYINVKVGEPKVELLPDKSGLTVSIGITEGDQFTTGSIDFKGDLLETKELLKSKVKLLSGEVFSREVLRGDIFTLTDLYADQGYAFANVSPLTKIDQEKKTVDITFDFEKGDKVYIERINISGNTKTRDKVIRREFRLAEGDLYSSTALKRSKQNLANLGFFEEAAIVPSKGSSSEKLNLDTKVKEKSTGQFSVGAGYSSSDGIIGQGSIQQNNFLGLGLKGTLSASIGGSTQLYNIGLTDPYFLDTDWTLGFDLYRSERDYEDYTRRVTGGDIKAGYRFSDELSTFWLYKYEVKSLFDFSTAMLLNPDLLTETSGTIGSLYGSVTYDVTDYKLDPSDGYKATLSAEYAGLGGNQRFARFIGQSSVFFPLMWSTVLSLRGELGYMMKIGKDIPIDEKFYLGGISTLRGYDSRTVCPVKTTTLKSVNSVTGLATTYSTPVYLGGIKEAVFNMDYVFPIIKEAGLKGVLFFDAGNSYGAGEQYFSKILMSYGLGVRWYSPMGPLRLEYGIPVNPRDGIDSAGGKFEFSIGGFF